MQLQFYSYPLRLKHTFTVATCSRSQTPDIIVRLTDGERVGYGEASLPPYLGETEESASKFLQQVDLSPFKGIEQKEEILSYLDHLEPNHHAAKAAIDIALHDLEGKALGVPLYALWNLNPNLTPPTTYTIGIDSPKIVMQRALEVKDHFKRLKIKVGTPQDKEIIEAIRSVCTLPLIVDANQGWKNKEEALEMIYWLAEHNVQLVEQPLSTSQIDDLAWITERSPIPIIADESVQRLSDLPQLSGVVNGINIKLMKCTGIAEAKKMIKEARKRDMLVMIGCMTETSCAVTAAAHLSPLADYVDLDGNLLIDNDPFIGGITISNGRPILPDTPGIGVTPEKFIF